MSPWAVSVAWQWQDKFQAVHTHVGGGCNGLGKLVPRPMSGMRVGASYGGNVRLGGFLLRPL